MREFSFEILVRETADGRTRVCEGAHWLRLAQRLRRQGRARLVEHSRSFAGYGGSYDVGYTRHYLTVYEI